MKTAILIPARLQSTRLPQKLLLDLGGMSILQRTYEQALKTKRAVSVFIATDAEEIRAEALSFGADVVMTRPDHQSGSERIAEAAADLDADIIVNVQGDEPEINPGHIDALIETHAETGAFASTLACPFPAEADPTDPSAVKAILGKQLGAPDRFQADDFTRKLTHAASEGKTGHFLHIGVYAFSKASLMQFAAAPQGLREKAERLEQLRILEMGETIAVQIVKSAPPGIDTPEDYARARKRFNLMP